MVALWMRTASPQHTYWQQQLRMALEGRHFKQLCYAM
jgi:hypothetical protein